MNIIRINDYNALPYKIGNFNTIIGNVFFGKNVVVENNCTIATKDSQQKIIIGDNTTIKNNVIIEGNVSIGDNNKIYHGCIIGSEPQQKDFVKYKNQEKIIIGSNNIIRENSTIEMPYNEQTKIGNNNYIMNNVIIAHDVTIEDKIIISSGVCLGGHVLLQNYCNIGLNCEIHQFCRIGEYSMIGMGTSLKKDLLPFHIFYKDKLSINFMGFSKNLNFQNYSFSSKNLCEDLLSFKNKKDFKNQEIRDIFEKFISNTMIGYYNWE